MWIPLALSAYQAGFIAGLVIVAGLALIGPVRRRMSKPFDED